MANRAYNAQDGMNLQYVIGFPGATWPEGFSGPIEILGLAGLVEPWARYAILTMTMMLLMLVVRNLTVMPMLTNILMIALVFMAVTVLMEMRIYTVMRVMPMLLMAMLLLMLLVMLPMMFLVMTVMITHSGYGHAPVFDDGDGWPGVGDERGVYDDALCEVARVYDMCVPLAAVSALGRPCLPSAKKSIILCRP